ncbi:MAG: glycosyltransferase family 4 protein [Puniceicoccaceae bacterium]
MDHLKGGFFVSAVETPKMKIWIVNPYETLAFGGNGLRYSCLSEALVSDRIVDQGEFARPAEVVWWTADWCHGGKCKRRVSGRIPAGITIKLLEVRAYRRNISLQRIRSHRDFARSWAREAEGEARRSGLPALILFSVPPMETGAVALRLGRQFGCKVVMDVMDAWPDSLLLAAPPVPGGRWIGRLLLKPYRSLFKSYCHGVDAVIAQSEAFADHARRFGWKGEVPIFYLGGQQGRGRKLEETDSSQRGVLKRTIKMVYLGSMGKVYDLETLIRAMAIFKADSERDFDLQLKFIGHGGKLNHLKLMVTKLGLEDSVHFAGFLSGEELTKAMEGADVGIIAMWPGSGVAIPYKVGDYLGAGLAVVSSLPGELEDLLEAWKCGFRYIAGDPRSLVSAWKKVAGDESALVASKRGAAALFREKFDRQKISERFAGAVLGYAASE